MKVILLADVPKVGNKYDVKDFAQGYAQNVLISRGLAILATPHELGKLEAKKASMQKKRDEEAKAFSELISTLSGKVITLKAKANEKGHLFSAVAKKEVASAIQSSSGVFIEEDHIVFPKPIKEIGSHKVHIKRGDREGECTVVVEKA